MMPPLVSRAATSAGGAATVSGEARRIVGDLRDVGGAMRLADLGALRAGRALGTFLRELCALELVEVLDADGRPVEVDAVALMLRSAMRTRVADYTVRLLPGADSVALRVAPLHA